MAVEFELRERWRSLVSLVNVHLYDSVGSFRYPGFQVPSPVACLLINLDEQRGIYPFLPLSISKKYCKPLAQAICENLASRLPLFRSRFFRAAELFEPPSAIFIKMPQWIRVQEVDSSHPNP